MVTKFDIGDKVYFNHPAAEWGWIERIIVTKYKLVYEVRKPDGVITKRPETALRQQYAS